MPRWAWISIVTIILSVTGWSILRYQEKSEFDYDQMLSQAAKEYAAMNWSETESLYLEILDRQSENKLAWYRLGVAYHFQSKYPEARQAFNTSMNLGFSKSIVSYNIACSHAKEGNTEKALASLRQAVDGGFDAVKWIKKDPDLKSLHGNDEFEEIVVQSQKMCDQNHEAKGSSIQKEDSKQ